jgi:hypothetical protein
MNRTNFYNIFTHSDNVQELDFLDNSLSSFKMKYDPTYYRVIGADLMRPDRISDKNYGSPNFWWIICLVNNINNPLLDLEVGQILKIPHQLDLYSFQRKYRLRRSR